MNKVEQFFDKLASHWDECDDHSLEEKKALLDKIKINNGDQILDVACGTGVITGLLQWYSNSEVLGIDISNNMILQAKKKYEFNDQIKFIHQDLLTMNEDKKYDIVVIYNAYPHFLNPSELSEKLAKILTKNGKVAILHSLSREALSKHHSAKAAHVSRDLLSPKEEFESFKNQFDEVLLEEDNRSYTFIVKKK